MGNYFSELGVKNFFLGKNRFVSGKYKKKLGGTGDLFFQTGAKNFFVRKYFFFWKIRNFLGKNFFSWVSQVGGPDESISHYSDQRDK